MATIDQVPIKSTILLDRDILPERVIRHHIKVLTLSAGHTKISYLPDVGRSGSYQLSTYTLRLTHERIILFLGSDMGVYLLSCESHLPGSTRLPWIPAIE